MRTYDCMTSPLRMGLGERHATGNSTSTFLLRRRGAGDSGSALDDLNAHCFLLVWRAGDHRSRVLIRPPAIEAVIAVAIGTVIAGVLIMGMFIMYNDERDRIAQQREASAEIQGYRICEDIGATLGLDGNINFTNNWGAATEVKGILVRCDDGRVIASDEQQRIPASGGTISNSTDMDDKIRDLLARCNPP